MSSFFFRLPALTSFAVLFSCTFFASVVRADSFGSGDNAFQIEFVSIGNPGNSPDASGNASMFGTVDYSFRIAKFEISEGMIDRANAQSLLDGNALNLTHDGRGADKPATNISWFEAAQFVNWLNTSKGYSPAYKFVEVPNPIRPNLPPTVEFALWEPGDLGFDGGNLFRNANAKYVLPTTDEWYKAAYFDQQLGSYNPYPTGGFAAPVAVLSGTTPGTAVYSLGTNRPTVPADIMLAGGPSAYGTIGQGGNVEEWLETEIDQVNDDPTARRGAAGGFWESSLSPLASTVFLADPLPGGMQQGTGFRVVFVPEPAAMLMAGFVCMSLGSSRKFQRAMVG